MSGLFWAIIALVLLLRTARLRVPMELGPDVERGQGCAGNLERSRDIRLTASQFRLAERLAVGDSIRHRHFMDKAQAQSFTPATWHHPLWSTTAETLGTDTSSAISLNPFDTLSGLARLLAYAGIFWISLQYCRRTVRARQVLLLVHIRWFRLRALRSRRPINQIRASRSSARWSISNVTSTFVDRDAFATYTGLALVCCTGLLLMLLAHVRAAASGSKHGALRFIQLSLRRGWPLMLTWLMLSLARVLRTPGRAFSVSCSGCSRFSSSRESRGWPIGLALPSSGLCAAGLVWIIGIGGGRSLGWLLPMSLSLGEHSLVHERTIEAIRDSGMLGTGFGTFEEAFRFYRTDDIQGDFGTSHFTYLANVLELGIPVAAALFACSLFSRPLRIGRHATAARRCLPLCGLCRDNPSVGPGFD